MNSLTFGLISLGSIFTGTLVGLYLRRILPESHLCQESRDSMKMAWGIVATMSALVLGLLLSTAKSSFDTISNEITQAGAKIIVLDQVFERYGPETKAARTELRLAVNVRVQKIWSKSHDESSGSASLAVGRGLNGVFDEMDKLTPETDSKKALLSQAEGLTNELIMARWLALEQSRTVLPNIFFIVLVLWLTLLFIGIGLLAPAHKTMLITLLLCNLCLSAAIFLIEEMNHPLDGMVQVSSAPMVEALDYLNTHKP